MEAKRVAVVQLCIDDRLDHQAIRAQVAQKLNAIYLRADHIFLVNEVGGNFGANFRNTIDLFRGEGAQVVFCAVLHHDDCRAASAGRRQPLEQTTAEIAAYVTDQHLDCPVYAGNIQTSSNAVTW